MIWQPAHQVVPMTMDGRLSKSWFSGRANSAPTIMPMGEAAKYAMLPLPDSSQK